MRIKLDEKKKQSGRGPSYIAQEKSCRVVICPLIVIYCDSRYAGGRLDICMRNWQWHKGMNLLTHGRTHEWDASRKWGLPYAIVYVERWSGIGRLSMLARWHVSFILHHVRGRSTASKRVSEQLVEKKTWRPTSLFSSTLPFAVLHVTRGQERGKLNVSVAMEYRSEARPRARR